MQKTFKSLIIITFLLLFQGSSNFDITQNAVEHSEKGVMHFRNGYYKAAITEFKTAILLNPNSSVTASFYNNLGLVYMKIDEYEWAIDSFENAAKINPNFISYYLNILKAIKRSGKINAFLEKQENIRKENPNNSASWLLCGLIYKDFGENKKAKEYLKQFCFLEPDIILTSSVNRILNEIE